MNLSPSPAVRGAGPALQAVATPSVRLPPSLERFRGCLLGLAVGEAFGAHLGQADPLRDAARSEQPSPLSDDTQLAMYVSRGLLAAFDVDRGDKRVGEGVARQLVEWYRDPAAQGRAPDPSSLAAIGQIVAGSHGWKDSGHGSGSPSVVAVRAAPIGLAFAPDQTDGPARASTWVTHHDGHAHEAALFVAWTVSRLVRGADLTPGLVEEGRHRIVALDLGGSLADSLADALSLYAALRDRPRQWLPSRDISPGDGGWQAESAVGLAILCALLVPAHTPAAFEKAIGLAARIHGDSVGVATLTGMLLGARRGPAVLPTDWLAPLESREVLLDLAEALHRQASGL